MAYTGVTRADAAMPKPISVQTGDIDTSNGITPLQAMNSAFAQNPPGNEIEGGWSSDDRKYQANYRFIVDGPAAAGAGGSTDASAVPFNLNAELKKGMIGNLEQRTLKGEFSSASGSRTSTALPAFTSASSSPQDAADVTTSYNAMGDFSELSVSPGNEGNSQPFTKKDLWDGLGKGMNAIFGADGNGGILLKTLNGAKELALWPLDGLAYTLHESADLAGFKVDTFQPVGSIFESQQKNGTGETLKQMGAGLLVVRQLNEYANGNNAGVISDTMEDVATLGLAKLTEVGIKTSLANVERIEGKDFFNENVLLNTKRQTLAEIDEIDMRTKTLFEDKSANKFGDRLSADLSPAERDAAIRDQITNFIDDKVVFKAESKIRALSDAVDIKPNGNGRGTRVAPDLEDIRDFKNMTFRFEGSHPVLQEVMNDRLLYLQQKYQDFNFKVIYDYKPGGKK